MKKILITLLLAISIAPLASAQEEVPVPAVSTEPRVVAYDAAMAMKPVALDGFLFKVPDGCIVSKAADGHIMAKAADGSFGITAAIYEITRPDKQAQKTCKDLAKEMKVNKPKISDYDSNGLKGNKLAGTLEGRDVNAAAIYSGSEKMLVIAVLSRPEHKQWASQVLGSVEYRK